MPICHHYYHMQLIKGMHTGLAGGKRCGSDEVWNSDLQLDLDQELAGKGILR